MREPTNAELIGEAQKLRQAWEGVTHWEGCWLAHPLCLAARLADALEASEKELAMSHKYIRARDDA